MKHRSKKQPPHLRLVPSLKRMMALRDISTPHRYVQKLGIPQGSATAWLHNRNASLRLEQLEKLCLALNCTPNDLFSCLPAGRQGRAMAATCPQGMSYASWCGAMKF